MRLREKTALVTGGTRGIRAAIARRFAEQGAAVIRTPYFGVPDDVAWAAVYLASNEARCVTGALILIDGGALA